MRIAFLSTIVPNTLRTGSEIASRAILSILEELGHEVRLYAYGRQPFRVVAPVDTVLLGTIPIETALAPAADKLAWAWRSLRSGLPISSEKYNYLPPAALRDEIMAGRPDLLIVDHVNLFPFVEPLAERLPTGVVFHDLQALSYAMVARGARRPWWRAIYAREARLNAAPARRAGQTRFSWFLSRDDADRAAAELGIAGGEVLPLYFPLQEPAAVAPASSPACDVALIGTWSWPPVGQGIRWFLDEVVPRLAPETTIAVAGSGSLDLPEARIRRMGLVPDARAFLASSRVSAVPTVAGTGIQIKTLELAATGTPAVSTPLGVRGLDTVPPNLKVAGSAAEFAEALMEAVRHPRPHDPSAGRAWNDARRAGAVAMVREALAAL
jgi:glycosyltransferase involved in cell wall biosynthesis